MVVVKKTKQMQNEKKTITFDNYRSLCRSTLKQYPVSTLNVSTRTLKKRQDGFFCLTTVEDDNEEFVSLIHLRYGPLSESWTSKTNAT